MRREQRDISKRDLIEALKHGTKEHQAYRNRWKIQHDGVTFITDKSQMKEVTAFASPLSLATISDQQREEYEKAKLVLDSRPGLIASHTILVVDNSGSMTKRDIPFHRCRQSAAYSETGLELVAEQLLQGTANNSDVVSLVEFSHTSKLVFEREPVSWILYNKILSRRDLRSFSTRRKAYEIDITMGDSNYLPALESTAKLLHKYAHDNAALSVLFLSDGEPSDAKHLNITLPAAEKHIHNKVREIAQAFGGRFHFMAAGFASNRQDFSVLEAMAKTVQETGGETAATFMHCKKLYSAVGSAVSNLVASTTKTRTALRGERQQGGRTARGIASESASGACLDWGFYIIKENLVYNPGTKEFVRDSGLPPGALSIDNAAKARATTHCPPPYLAMNKHHCGEGAERLAFRCFLANKEDDESFVFEPMVAKETNLVERIEENFEYHRSFAETQSLANHLAEQFNSRMKGLQHYDAKKTPMITFLKCSILMLEDHQWPQGERPVLVEKMLDVSRYGWCKWNANDGYVHGGIFAHPAINVDLELENMRKAATGPLDDIKEVDTECESEESEDESGDETECEDTTPVAADKVKHGSSASEIVHEPADFLQAFSHFSYLSTNRKVLVCDLQGIFKHDATPPIFQLTDPAVHYSSKNGRRNVFGRTDLGREGMDLFFCTHKCNQICKMLELSRRNMHWRKDWAAQGDISAASRFEQLRPRKKRRIG
jgi:Mg-chelatase subunit ChlD